MISLHMRSLTHRYHDRTVLRDVHLEVPAGARFALVGHNGSGKSTLLRLLAFLERPTAGEVFASSNGTRLSDDLSLRRRIVLVLQRPLLLNTSVLANVLYGLKVRWVPRPEARERAEEALETAGLTGLAHRSARLLSGGEVQLLNLARALAIGPEVLLLDEVTSHLDPANEERVEEIISRLAASGRVTTVLVTQDHEQAARLADRGALLRNGQVVRVGEIGELFRG